MLVEWLVRTFWQTPSHPVFIYRQRYDIVVAISYSSRRDRLALGTEMVFRTAIRLFRKQGNTTLLAYGDAGNSFPKAELTEGAFKKILLRELNVDQNLAIEAGRIMNSVTEAMRIKESLVTAGKNPKNILVVCTMMHSRTVRYIWKKTFPDAWISIYCIDGFSDVEKGHQILLQRTRWVWFIANILRHAALRTFGLRLVGKVVHISAG